MTMTGGSNQDFLTACNTIMDFGYDVVVADQYKTLRAWLDANDYWPPVDWQPSERTALKLHSSKRCDDQKIVQAFGAVGCCRFPGHYGRHWDGHDERWT